MYMIGAPIALAERTAIVHNNVPQQAEDAPSPDLLTRISQSAVRKFLGSYTVKYFSGIIIGIGLTLTPLCGIGLGLIVAGAVLLSISIALSADALPDKDFNSISWHVAKSLVCAAMGLGIGISAIPLTTIGATSHPGVGYLITTMAVILGNMLPVALDALQSRENESRALRINARPIAPELKNDINALLTTLFASDELITVPTQTNDADAAEIQFAMEERHDKISCNPINGSTSEWIAVQKTTNCYELFEASSFYNEAGQVRYLRHPYTRTPMPQVAIIRGQPLLNLLRQAQPIRTVQHTQSDSPGINDASEPLLG